MIRRTDNAADVSGSTQWVIQAGHDPVLVRRRAGPWWRRGNPRKRAALVLAAATVVAAAAWLQHRVDPNTPRGDPDPGAHRLMYLRRVALGAVPDGGQPTTTVRRYSWYAGDCNDGVTGWLSASLDVTFRAASPDEVDAAMSALRWHRTPVEGGDAVRNYSPASPNRLGADASLFRDRSGWDLELDVEPDPSVRSCSR